MADIANLAASSNVAKAENSTSRKGSNELSMQDFLQLMVVQLQNQTIDNAMDTSEMMNQMVQMQMISAITNMTETNIMSYASSLVGKVVTIGLVQGDSLEEREVEVIGTGVSNGQQVIFGKDGKGNVETYSLNQIMAVGHLPPLEGEETPDKPGESEGGGKVDGAGGSDKPTDKPGEGEDGGKVDGGEDSGETDKPAGSGGTPAPTMIESPEYTGEF